MERLIIWSLPRNRFELARVVKFANQENIPWMVLGNASNIIVRDGGIRGFVILCDKLNNVSVDGYTIEAEAGANLIETTPALPFVIVWLVLSLHVAFLEVSVVLSLWMRVPMVVRLPTSCSLVKVLTKDGEIETLSAKDLAFWFSTHSAIQESGAVVLSAKFALAPGTHQVIQARNGTFDASTWT